MRMRADPDTYFITDHYTGYPWVLVRVAAILEDELRELLEDAWRRLAPTKLIAEHDAD